MSSSERAIEWPNPDSTEDPVTGFLHSPASPGGDALVLTHGAGGDCDSPLLRALARELAERGVTVLRCNLHYRRLRPKGPPRRGEDVRDRAGLAAAVRALSARGFRRVLLGGHSYGGRQASLLAAERPELASGLLLLSYPLHPPGKPDQLRTAHLPRLTIDVLFIDGARDPFGTPEERAQARALIPSRSEALTREGVGHDLVSRRKDPATLEQAAREIADAAIDFFDR